MAGTKDLKDRAFLTAISKIEGPASTKEIADEVGYTLSGCVNRLHSLEEEGSIASKPVGNTFVWWRVEQENHLQEIYNGFVD